MKHSIALLVTHHADLMRSVACSLCLVLGVAYLGVLGFRAGLSALADRAFFIGLASFADVLIAVRAVRLGPLFLITA